MAKSIIQSRTCTEIGNAIRTRLGITDPIDVSDFSSEIGDITNDTGLLRDKIIIPDRYNTGCKGTLTDFDAKFPNVSHSVKSATITANGGKTTFSNLSINGQMTFKANEVQVPITFKNCKFYGGGSYAINVSPNVSSWTANNALIFEDCEFDGFSSACCYPLDRSVFKRCKIHNMRADGGKGGFSNGGYEDCLFYDIGKNTEESHADGIQTTGYNRNFYIKNCRFDMPCTRLNNSNAGIFFIQEQNSYNAIIENVLIFGGNYSVYLGLKDTSSGKVIEDLTGSNIKIGYGEHFGIFNCNYADYSNWVSNGTISRQDKVFVSTVKAENGIITLYATNYTNEDRTLTLVSNIETKTVTVPYCYSFNDGLNHTMADYPFDTEFTIQGDRVYCYDGDTLIRTFYTTPSNTEPWSIDDSTIKDWADSIRLKSGMVGLIPVDEFADIILNMIIQNRPIVPQTGTWQFKTTPTKGLLIIGKDDDTADEAMFVRMLKGYGFKFVLNTEPVNINKALTSDADTAVSLYPEGTTAQFPNGTNVTDLCKYVIANDLGEIAQHDESSQTLWDSALLDNYISGFYDTYFAGGGLKTEEELKQAIIEKYADTDVRQGAMRVLEQRAILENAIEDFVLSIGQWGGTPNIVIDGIIVGTMQNLKTGFNTLSRVNNYYADSTLATYGVQTKGTMPYYITRNSGFTAAAADWLCQEIYKDRYCSEIFTHSIINYGTAQEWEDFKDVLDAIKEHVDANKIEIITRKELYALGEFVANPIKAISITPDETEYLIDSVITEANFVCKATLNDNTQVACESDRIIDLSQIDTTTAGSYTVTMWYRGFKTTTSVTVVSSGLVLPEYVRNATSGYYQTFRFANDTDKCYCIYLAEASNGFVGNPFVSAGAWVWQPKVKNFNMRIYYSGDGSATWTQLCNRNSPQSIKSNMSDYFGSYIFYSDKVLSLDNIVHITT